MGQFEAEVRKQRENCPENNRCSEASLNAVFRKFLEIFKHQGQGAEDAALCLRLAAWLDEEKRHWRAISGSTDPAIRAVPLQEVLADPTSWGQWIVSSPPHLEVYGFNYTKDVWGEAGTEGRKIGGTPRKWGLNTFDHILLSFLRGLFPITAAHPSLWTEQQREDAYQRWNSEHPEHPYTTFKGFKKRCASALAREQRGKMVRCG